MATGDAKNDVFEGNLQIAVVGGSIGGLSAGLALNGAGFDVRVYERARGAMDTRGAGIVVQNDLLDLLVARGAPPLPMTSCRRRRFLEPDGGDGSSQAMPQFFTSWEAIFTTLRAAFPQDRYHSGEALSRVSSTASTDRRRLEFESGMQVEADILVCADGAQSASRRRLLPDVRPSYAGYVAWRGTIDEADTPPDVVRFFDDTFSFSEARSGGHMLTYFIPGESAVTEPGRRRLNWVWYVGATREEIQTLLVDRAGHQHKSSLPRGGARDDVVRALAVRARGEVHPKMADLVAATVDPYLQTIVDVIVPRTVFGRECLLGDAAFVVRPHTAGATGKAARDATLLARSLTAFAGDIDGGLRAFQALQLDYGHELTRYGIALGKRWAANV